MIVKCNVDSCGYCNNGFCSSQIVYIEAHGICAFTTLANKSKDTREIFLNKNPADARPIEIEDAEEIEDYE